MITENTKLIKSTRLLHNETYDKQINFRNSQIDSFVSSLLNKVPVINSTKLSDLSKFKSLNYRISNLNIKIKSLSNKLNFKKSQEISKSMDLIKNSIESQNYLHSVKKYIIEDEDNLGIDQRSEEIEFDRFIIKIFCLDNNKFI